jgi:hypothetical protein
MIRRIVEYAVQCDGPDCHESLVWGATTREQCEREAPAHGFVRCTRGRWLCKHCAARLLPKDKAKH